MNPKNNRMHEEDYFRKQDAKLRAKRREKSQIKELGIENEELAKGLLSAGFNHDSKRALVFVPLVETAWADEEIQEEEHEEILSSLIKHGIHSDSEAYHLISLWLQKPPTDLKYNRAKELLQPMIEELKIAGGKNPDWILESANRVAEATGCTLFRIGLWKKTSSAEKRVIEKITAMIQG